MTGHLRFAVAAGSLALWMTAAGAWAQDANSRTLPADWLQRLGPEHPRMFFTQDTWPAVKAYVLEHEGEYYQKIKRTVASLPLEPDPNVCERGSNRLYGPHAQRCAFVWRMEGDKAALAKARNYMLAGMRFYRRCDAGRRPVNWYSASRVCALTAYDWIHDQLTPAERKDFAEGMFTHYRDCLSGPSFPGQNRSDHTTGFYGDNNMAWYVGLAFHKDGVDDQQAVRLLRQGFQEHLKLLNYRAASAGDDGGTGSLAVGYGLGMYPWAEFNFMHTFNSATGLAVEESFDHLSLFPQWVMWNFLPGGMSWGLADSVPASRVGSAFLEMHMLQIAHFYARTHPHRARLAMWVRQKLLPSQQHDDYWWPLAPLLTWRCGQLPKPHGPDTSWPHAQNFQNMGVVMMRGDWTDDAVCAAFVAGGDIPSHRHYDQGHFIIYRKGAHLALDSGDYGPRERNEHLTEYLYRTVAHNSLLIHAPAEADQPPKVWGGACRTLDGGQCRLAGKQIAFETNYAYTYAAVDMTDCYDARKCKQAVRQFLFIHPDTFVICDRVTAAKPEYKKVWLLHSVNEPKIDDATFRIEYEGSALSGSVLLPARAKIAAVGGPGKEFLSAGSNRTQTSLHKGPAGAWRIEVSPGAQQESDVFLVALRCAPGSQAMMPPMNPLGGRGRIGCQLNQLMMTSPQSRSQLAESFFHTVGPVGGHIAIAETTGLKVLKVRSATDPNLIPGTTDRVNQDLTTEVQPQAGIPPERAK